MKSTYLFLSLAFLYSCATPPPMTAEESLRARQSSLKRAEDYKKVTQRDYPGVSKEKLIAAAEKVLRLADNRDFKLKHRENGFIAKRDWMVYAVFIITGGKDVWDVTVEGDHKNSKITFGVVSSQGTTGAGITAGGDVFAQNGQIVSLEANGESLYHVFWERLDYVLGLKNTWMDCKKGLTEKEKNKWKGNLDRICDSITLDDHLPDGLPEDELKRIYMNDKFKIRSYVESGKRDPR